MIKKLLYCLTAALLVLGCAPAEQPREKEPSEETPSGQTTDPSDDPSDGPSDKPSDNPTGQDGEPAELSVVSDMEFGSDGRAQLTVRLSHAVSAAVPVDLILTDMTSKDYAIPAERLEFPQTVTVEAGATEANATIRLDAASLERGSYEAIIRVASQSPLAVDGDDVYATIAKEVALKLNFRTDWTVEWNYGGMEYIEEDERDARVDHFTLSGMGGAYYWFSEYDDSLLELVDGTLAGFFGEFELMVLEEVLAGARISELGLDNSDPLEFIAYNLSPGDYQFIVATFNDKGYLTGDYAILTARIPLDCTETYRNWLGRWQITQGSTTWTWLIEAEEVDRTYRIVGLENITANSIIAQLEEDGSLAIYAQPSPVNGKGMWHDVRDTGFWIKDYLYGVMDIGGRLTQIEPDGYLICRIVPAADGKSAGFVPASLYIEEAGATLPFVGMQYFGHKYVDQTTPSEDITRLVYVMEGLRFPATLVSYLPAFRY